MRFLIFLLLGTLVFGFAFPAMIMFLGLIAIAVFAMIIYNLLRGGSYFKVYTNRTYDPHSARQESTSDNPEIIEETVEENDSGDYVKQDSGFEDEGEIVELPSTALRKEDEDK